LKDALAGTDIDAVKRAHESLIAASQEFAQRLYAQASQQPAGDAGADAGSTPSDDEVADAEIIDEDQQKGA
jgi:molecular chaperone DnaK